LYQYKNSIFGCRAFADVRCNPPQIGLELSPMSIFGKLGGAAAGFMLGGGPIGALIGALAGHFLIDREMPTLEPGEAPGVVFTIAMIAHAAKMAKADGRVTDDEIETFHRLFRVAPAERSSVDRVFRLAQQDTAGFEAYATQIAKMLAG